MFFHPLPTSDTRPNSPSPIIETHIDYYLPGGDLFIQVDTTIFHVHSYFFNRESQDCRNLIEHTVRGRNGVVTPIILSDEFALSSNDLHHFHSILMGIL